MEALYKNKVSGTNGDQHNISGTSGYSETSETSGTSLTEENSGTDLADKDKDKIQNEKRESRTKRENEDDRLKITETIKMKVTTYILFFSNFFCLVAL